MSELSPATRTLANALAPRNGSVMHEPFRELCNAENRASTIMIAGIFMPGSFRNDAWTKTSTDELLLKGYTAAQVKHFYDVHTARKEVLNERLGRGARVRAYLALTAFQDCTFAPGQARYMRQLAERGVEFGFVPDLSQDDLGGVTSLSTIDGEHVYAQFPPDATGEHQAWYPNDTDMARKSQKIYEGLKVRGRSIESALDALEIYGIVSKESLRWVIDERRAKAMGHKTAL